MNTDLPVPVAPQTSAWGYLRTSSNTAPPATSLPTAMKVGVAAIDALFEVQTFYEAQYLAQGFPITYLAFLADHTGDYISPEWAEDLWKDEGHHFVIPSGLPVASKFYPEG